MATPTAARYIELAKGLHPRLQRFLAKYPPNQILPASTRTNTIKDGAIPNPFLPHKHPVTGKWHDPEFSLRRQAEIVKLAREQGVEELLPFTSKGTEERLRNRVEHGLRVRGTGVGQKVKGHLHERMLPVKYVALIGVFALNKSNAEDRVLTMCLQDGEEENSDVGHAEACQAVAKGGQEGLDQIPQVVADQVGNKLSEKEKKKKRHCRQALQKKTRKDIHKADEGPSIPGGRPMAPSQLVAGVDDDGPSYYEVLSITPKSLEGQAAPAQARLVKKAYHRALLQNHPDKAQSHGSTETSSSSSSGPGTTSSSKTTTTTKTTTSKTASVATLFTVDQIQRAYTVLSDVRQRAEYNRNLTLRQQQQQRSSSSSSPHHHNHRNNNGNNNGGGGLSASFSFRTSNAASGPRTIDLDDADFDERTGVYSTGCRCGNPQAYRFTEDDLEAFEADGVLMVECLDCSLWIRVLFAPAAEDDDEDGRDEGADGGDVSGKGAATTGLQRSGSDHDSVRSQQQQHQRTVSKEGSSRGSNGGWSFNWSFNLGISVGGTASASGTASRGGSGSGSSNR